MDVKLIFQLVQVEFKVPKWGRRDTECLGWGRGHPAYLQGNAGGQENLTTYQQSCTIKLHSLLPARQQGTVLLCLLPS